MYKRTLFSEFKRRELRREEKNVEEIFLKKYSSRREKKTNETRSGMFFTLNQTQQTIKCNYFLASEKQLGYGILWIVSTTFFINGHSCICV